MTDEEGEEEEKKMTTLFYSHANDDGKLFQDDETEFEFKSIIKRNHHQSLKNLIVMF